MNQGRRPPQGEMAIAIRKNLTRRMSLLIYTQPFNPHFKLATSALNVVRQQLLMKKVAVNAMLAAIRSVKKYSNQAINQLDN